VVGSDLLFQLLRFQRSEDHGLKPAWGKKVNKIRKLGLVVYGCNPSWAGSISRRITVQVSLGKKPQDPI
jgi:hypothetical protein